MGLNNGRWSRPDPREWANRKGIPTSYDLPKVNKADTEKQARIVDEFHRLGIKQMFPISAEHGRGIDDLLDAVLEVLPAPAEDLNIEDTEDREEAREKLSHRGDQLAANPGPGAYSTCSNMGEGCRRRS